MGDQADIRVHCIADCVSRAEALEAITRVLVPDAQFTRSTRPSVPAPAPDVAIVDVDPTVLGPVEGGTAQPDVEAVRRLRAGGFAGGIIVVSEALAAPDEAVCDELSRLGAVRTSAARLASALAASVVAALETRADDMGAAVLLTQLGRTRQLLSAGEIAIGLQHSMNNPLAAILAESQLLEMDTLTKDQREAVARIVALCRRMTAVVRRLDGIGGPVGGAAPPATER